MLRMFFRMSNPTILGEIGEKQVAMELKRLPSEYITINDVLLSMGNFSSQIDHIVLSPKGIFVIETKNYTGWIFGNKSNREWTKVYYRDKYRFYNPILQNDKHISVLKEFLSKEVENIEKIPFYSLIVFPNPDCELKEVPDCAIKSDILRYTIQYTKPKARLNESEINEISNYIKDNNMSSNKQYVEKHIEYAKTSKAKAGGTFEEYKEYNKSIHQRKPEKYKNKNRIEKRIAKRKRPDSKRSNNRGMLLRLSFLVIMISIFSLIGNHVMEQGFETSLTTLKNTEALQDTEVEQIENTPLETTDLTQSRKWIPYAFGENVGIGQTFVINRNVTDEQFLHYIITNSSKDKDVIYLEFFLNEDAVTEHMETLEIENPTHSENYKRNFLAVYVKNLGCEKGEYFGEHKLIWKQQVGDYADKYGQEVDLKDIIK